jgi:cytochrome c553
MKKVVVTLLALMTLSGSVFAKGDAEVGKRQSDACMACHGATGVSPNDAWPNLAGQGYEYLVKQMKAFRDGTRKDPLMEPMAKRLSEQDIENLSAFYSAQAPVPAGARALAATPLAAASVAHVPIVSTPEVFVPRPHPTRQHWGDQMPNDEGRSIIWQKCQLCHDLQRTIAFVRPKEQWQQVVESMPAPGSRCGRRRSASWVLVVSAGPSGVSASRSACACSRSLAVSLMKPRAPMA